MSFPGREAFIDLNSITWCSLPTDYRRSNLHAFVAGRRHGTICDRTPAPVPVLDDSRRNSVTLAHEMKPRSLTAAKT